MAPRARALNKHQAFVRVLAAGAMAQALPERRRVLGRPILRKITQDDEVTDKSVSFHVSSAIIKEEAASAGLDSAKVACHTTRRGMQTHADDAEVQPGVFARFLEIHLFGTKTDST